MENQSNNILEDQHNDSDDEVNLEEQFVHDEQFVNGRRVVTLIGDTFLSSHLVAQTISRAFKSRIDLQGSSWEKVSSETKDYYFEEFRKAYHWEDGMEARVKQAWTKKASKSYSNTLSKAKCRNRKPEYVQESAWKEWWTQWERADSKRKSETNKENRKGKDGVGPSKHTGGSISSMEHKIRLAKKLGRDPTHTELFLYTHTRKGDGQTFVGLKSKAVHDRVLAIRQQREDNSEVIDDNQIYLEAATKKRNDRVYGLGSVGTEHCKKQKSVYTSIAYTSELENKVKDLEQVVSNVTQQLEETKQGIDERVRQLFQEMVANMYQTSSSNNRSFPPIF